MLKKNMHLWKKCIYIYLNFVLFLIKIIKNNINIKFKI